MLTDSHCHLDCLDLTNYSNDIYRAIDAARLKGVKYILSPGVSLETLSSVLKIVEPDPDLFAAIGIHPTEEKAHEPTSEELLSLGDHKKIIAVGETGLDFYYAKDNADKRRHEKLFRLHIQVAKELNKPLIIHARDADQEVIQILKEEGANQIGGVLHCFTGSLEMAQAALGLGFYISFSGIITFKNADNLRMIAKEIPFDKVLIETDAPYLAPTPMRGKPNEPAYLPYTAEFMAKFLNIPEKRFAEQTTANFLQFCRL